VQEIAQNRLDQTTLSPSDQERRRAAIRKKYTAVAVSAQGKFHYPTGREGAPVLNYDADILKKMPDNLLRSFCGVGNPFALGRIEPGESVLDIGSGAGFDLIVAHHLTGPQGRVCGVDLTAEMVERSRLVCRTLGLENIETHHILQEEIPHGDRSFDVVISNGVINLSPAKDALFREIFRVLKPGGRLQFADMVLDGELPSGMADNLEAWSQ
jgi:SAM-dependent methyltransferase